MEVDLLGVVILEGVLLGRTPEMFIVASNIGQQQQLLPIDGWQNIID